MNDLTGMRCTFRGGTGYGIWSLMYRYGYCSFDTFLFGVHIKNGQHTSRVHAQKFGVIFIAQQKEFRVQLPSSADWIIRL